MKYMYLLFLAAILAVAGCSTSDDPEGFSPGEGFVGDSSQDSGDTDNGDGTGENGEEEDGVVSISLESSAAEAGVGETVTITASVWYDEQQETAADAGITVTFLSAGLAGTLQQSEADTDASGQAQVTLEGVDFGTVQVSATAEAVESPSVTVVFLETDESEATVNPARIESALVGKTSVTVHDPESDRDEVEIGLVLIGTDGAPYEGGEITLRVSSGSLSATNVVTDESGMASVVYSSGTLSGDVLFTAEIRNITYTRSIKVGAGDPLILTVEDPTPASIGIRGSGSVESSRVGFFITDRYGNPVSDDTEVLFELQPVVSGSTISPLAAKTINGRVEPVINSGTKSGSLRVVATLPDVGDGEVRDVASSRIQIFGGVPAADKFELNYEPGKRIMSGFVLSGLQQQMTVRLADRYGNPPAPGTRISVHCEAGTCADNTETGLAVDNAGVVTFPFRTGFTSSGTMFNTGLPPTKIDFGPIFGLNHDYDLYPEYFLSGVPQDGWVNVLAWTTGESAFNDPLGTGVWDGDPASIRKHPSEPFLDRNSSGTYDAGIDEFYDFNNDGVWNDAPDPADREHTPLYVWDSLEVIFSTEPVVQIVPAQFEDFGGTPGHYSPLDWDTIVVGGPEGAGNIVSLYGAYDTGSTMVRVYVSDRNNNPLPRGSTVSYSLRNAPDGIELTSDNVEFQGRTIFDTVTLKEAESDREVAQMDFFDLCVNVSVPDLPDDYRWCFHAKRF